MANITVLNGSMRRNGNTDMLASSFYKGACEHNNVRNISVADYKVYPCTGCNACRSPRAYGKCCLDDDMNKIYDILSDTDILVICSPVYFYGISARLKGMIDRLHNPVRKQFHISKLGLLLVAADTLPCLFDSIRLQYTLTLEYFKLRSIGEIYVPGVEDIGDIKDNEALDRAYTLGSSL